jgi:hypothetical protein
LATEFWRDAGDDFSSSFTLAATFVGAASINSAALTTADGLTSGTTYRFYSRSQNAIGYSESSTVAFLAFGDVPSAPGAPQRVSSTRTSLTVSWTAPATAADKLPVLGYVLNMDDGVHRHLEPVYIGTRRPDVLEFTAGSLVTGRPY